MNELLGRYDEIAQLIGIDENDHLQDKINCIVKESLKSFMDQCDVPAIWCFGQHTKMLMADFIYELKNVEFIIDNNYQKDAQSGFTVITQDEIKRHHIDGIVVSSYKYREDIKNTIQSDFSDIKYLDIYDELEKNGISLSYEYYSQTHPYSRYGKINQLQWDASNEINRDHLGQLYREIIKEYVCMKDFRLALEFTSKLSEIEEDSFVSDFKRKLSELYQAELEAIGKIDNKNVLMLCIDGLRRRDFIGGKLPKFYKWTKENAYFFSNAYSMSTSTYESLLPAYSENDDLRTEYYNNSFVEEEDCRFIQEAIEQGRHIYFYTDTISYIHSSQIKVSNQIMTASEKIWKFINDAIEEENGLFYIHLLYESHFSYPNPYTTDKLVSDGTSILFDFLTINGGKLRTDYGEQQKAALTYIDDLLYPFLNNIKCRMIVYADHGNILLPMNAKISDIKREQLSYADELIEVPIIIKAPEYGIGEYEHLQTLKSVNDMIIGLLRRDKAELPEREYIKVVRSHIYNPDFFYIYKKCKYEQELSAFELFIFSDGTKIVIYDNGYCEVIFHKEEVSKYMDILQDKITVCDSLE